MKDDEKNKPSAAVFKVGAIALAFLIVGYQAALFMTRAGKLRLEANRDRPDTVFVYYSDAEEPFGSSDYQSFEDEAVAGVPSETRSPARLRKREGAAAGGRGKGSAQQGVWRSGSRNGATTRRNAQHSEYVEAYRRETRRVESFRFDPNTVSVEDLIRLGFSEKQAAALDRYRASGGRFRRKADFAKSFVVADSVYRRLEGFIDIPKVDLNRADSAALDDLPGIGAWYAKRILEYRAELGGYSFAEQLMDIYRFDREKFDALADLVCCSPPAPFALWSLPADSLQRHPYIRSRQAARSIVLFREHTPREGWTVAALGEAGILPPEDAARLARCAIAPP
jgi:DNA uptake protein ComE-like DNA-binding protein